jgi:hypothetical protein
MRSLSAGRALDLRSDHAVAVALPADQSIDCCLRSAYVLC